MTHTTAHTCHGARFTGAPANIARAQCPACPGEVTTAAGTKHEYRWHVGPGEEGPGTWPTDDHHTWTEFAGLAVECGGYGDLTLVDPGTGDRLWVSDAFQDADADTTKFGESGTRYFTAALRRALDVADAVNFFGPPAPPACRCSTQSRICDVCVEELRRTTTTTAGEQQS